VTLSKICARVVFSLAPLVCGAVGALPVHAGFVGLGPAADFNVFVFGDDTQSNTDSEGRIAVGGNANFGGYTVASSSPSSTDNLIVGGNFSNNGNTVHGGLLVNGNVTWSTPSLTGRLAVNGSATFTSGGSIAGPVNVVVAYSAPGYFPANANPPSVTPLPFSFSDVKTYLNGESNYLASLTPNGTTAVTNSEVHLTASGAPGSYIFDVHGSDLANAAGHGLFITAPAGSTVIVNVDGTADSFQSMGISLSGVDNQRVLYNFSQATTLGINTIGIEGTILAPSAAINFQGGQINGTLIGQSVLGQGEAHLHLFQGTLPSQPIPEPSTIVLAMCGAAALVATRYARTYRR
jgi:choice-of-anchor A domain-containing protein